MKLHKTFISLLSLLLISSCSNLKRENWFESKAEGLNNSGYEILGFFPVKSGGQVVINVPIGEETVIGFVVYEIAQLQMLEERAMVTLESVSMGSSIYSNLQIEKYFTTEEIAEGLRLKNPTSIKTHTLVFKKRQNSIEESP